MLKISIYNDYEKRENLLLCVKKKIHSYLEYYFGYIYDGNCVSQVCNKDLKSTIYNLRSGTKIKDELELFVSNKTYISTIN